MMESKRNVKVAWQDTWNVMSSAELRKRPLTMQIWAFAERSKQKKFRGTDSQLYAATCPLIYITRVFGLAPYEFNDNQLLVPSDTNMIYSIIWFCIYSYIIYDITQKTLNDPSASRGLLTVNEIIKPTFNYSVLMFDLIMCMFTRKQIAKIWNEIEDYDDIVRELGYARNERKTYVWVWSAIVIALIIYVAINQFGMYAFNQPWLDNVTYMIVYVGSAISVMKFCGIVILLGQRFDHLNEITRKCTSTTPHWMIQTPMADIRTIEHLHNHMMAIAENLNSIYSWSIMFWLGNLCFHNVCNLYSVTHWILLGKFYWDLIYCLTAWIMLFISQLIVISCACHYASSKANSISYIILGWKMQLYMRNRNTEVETSFRLLNRKLTFSAAGCFNVHLPLLQAIGSSLTTYLVILLQFD